MDIAVIGLGKIGLPLAAHYAKKGHDALSRISQALDTGFSEHGLNAPDLVVLNPSDHAIRH